MESYMKYIVYLCLLFEAATVKGEKSVFITILQTKQLRADDNNNIYQCYQTAGETSTSRTYGRYVNTRGGVGNTLNLPPTNPRAHCCEPNAQIINLPSQTQNNGFGVFYCRGTQPNKAVTTVTTIYLRPTARLHPQNEFFTRTVNVGDQDVTVAVKVANGHQSTKQIYWRFNDSDIIQQSTGSFTHTITGAVTKANEGVYEAVYAGERDDGNGALIRLIVRGCPANRWGAPNCNGICDKCYNGGICDDRSGLCICPPGFKGLNCMEACGGNSFGRNCEFLCSRSNPRPSACGPGMFCLPDPYGCTCNTGFHTLNCGIACSGNKFGAGCTQECHCTGNTCDPFTGACNLGSVCMSGWSGASCQIPAVCESDYYGLECTQQCHCLNDTPCDKNTGECPNRQCASGYNVYNDGVNCQECRGSTYGFACTGVCHCNMSSCDKATDECNGNCLPNWMEPDCQTGIESLSNIKVNPNQKSVFTCRVTGNPVPPQSSVILERAGGSTTGITFKSESVTGDTRSVLFEVNPVGHKENILCRLDGLGATTLRLIQANTYVLPELNTRPRVVDIGGISAEIHWDVWSNIINVGDAPVVAYRVHYKTITLSSWTSMDITSNGLSTTVTGLWWDTKYIFSVSAVRSGIGGEGPRGPSSDIVTTTKAVPSAAPRDITTPSASLQSFTVEWSPPRNLFGINISGYDIRYWQSDNRNQTTLISPAIEENPGSLNFPRYHQIANLQSMVEYSIQVRAKSSAGTGPWSEPPVTVVTEEGAPGHPDMLTYKTWETKVTLSWNRPRKPNGTIVLYYVEFRAIEKPYESNFKAPTDYKQNIEIPNPSYKRQFKYIVENLEPSTRYEFLVAASSKMGRGKASSVRIFTTGASNMPSPPSISAAGSTSLTITLSFTALSFKYFVSYVIGVEMKQRLSKRRQPDFNDSNAYITARISKFDFNGTFTVGDGKVYGNYENRALESNRNYDIYLGVTSGHGKNELVEWGAEPLSATAASMSSESSSSTAIWAAVGVITIAVVIVVILVAVYRKMKQKKNPRTPAHDDIEIRDIVAKSDEISDVDSGGVEYEDVDDLNDQEYEEVTVSKWNIPWKDLNLSGKILGKGSFGEVQLGRVWVKEKWVKAAVKTLKEGTPESERVLFKEEFDTMTKIGYHPNVVNVLGLCDYGGTLYVVLEYVPHGNLRKFLRKCRKESAERVTEPGKKGEEASNLSSDQLLNFTIGVAKAMKHVTSCGVIHRDLAARNVLVGKDMKPKVADFGMSRGEDVYVQKSGQRVPTRWLAIESLTRKTYSAQSDVWSFGILLWEIATFGGTPYPDLETKYIAYKLTDGYRMSKPDNCGDDMYELMLKCWKEVPEERPTFHDIVAILTSMTCKDEIYMSTGKYENFKYAAINPDKDDN